MMPLQASDFECHSFDSFCFKQNGLIAPEVNIGDDVLMYRSDYPHWDNDMPWPKSARVVQGGEAADFQGERTGGASYMTAFTLMNS